MLAWRSPIHAVAGTLRNAWLATRSEFHGKIRLPSLAETKEREPNSTVEKVVMLKLSHYCRSLGLSNDIIIDRSEPVRLGSCLSKY